MTPGHPGAMNTIPTPSSHRSANHDELVRVDAVPFPDPTFDAAVLQRYPRWCTSNASYPNTDLLSEEYGESEYRYQVQRSNNDLIPRQLSLHVRVPYCEAPSLHCEPSCTAVNDTRQPRAYIENLRREIAVLGPLFDRDRDVVELHLNQGSPSVLGPGELHDLIDSLARHFHFDRAEDRDFSITLDPRLVHSADIASYAGLGMNRALLGTSLSAAQVPAGKGRDAGQDLHCILKTVESCHDNGFRSVKVDVFHDFGKHTPAGLEAALNRITSVKPERLEFRIAGQHTKVAHRQLTSLTAAFEQLLAAGYEYLGLGNFVLPGDDLLQARRLGTLGRSLAGYTAHGDCDSVGLGASAFSHIADSLSQNPHELSSWEKALDEGRLPVARGLAFSLDDIIRRDVIQQILCRGRVDMAAAQERYFIDFAEYFADSLRALEPLIEDRLVEWHDLYFSTTSRGRTVLSIIASCFDKYVIPLS
jgi:oxygen-independent coproporphyrinogen III oxidase